MTNKRVPLLYLTYCLNYCKHCMQFYSINTLPYYTHHSPLSMYNIFDHKIIFTQSRPAYNIPFVTRACSTLILPNLPTDVGRAAHAFFVRVTYTHTRGGHTYKYPDIARTEKERFGGWRHSRPTPFKFMLNTRPTQPLPFPFVSLFSSRCCFPPSPLSTASSFDGRRKREREKRGQGGEESEPLCRSRNGFLFSDVNISSTRAHSARNKRLRVQPLPWRVRKKEKEWTVYACMRFIRECTQRGEERRARAQGDPSAPGLRKGEAFRVR